MSMPISPIMDALYHGRREDAERLAAEAGPDALSVHEAAALGRLDRLKSLLEDDPSLANAWAADGFQPLGLAAFFGQSEAATLLLARGGDVDTPANNSMRVTSLHAALAGPRPEIAYALVDAGADVNAVQQDGVTPLHEAAAIGRLDLVRLLLEHGADIGARDGQQRAARDFAQRSGHQAVVDLLDAHAAQVPDSAENPSP